MIDSLSRRRLLPIVVVVAACDGASGTTSTSSSDTTATGFFSSGTTASVMCPVGGAGGAGHTGGGGAGGAALACLGAPTGVSFANDVIPIFTSCAGELCHGAPTYDSTVGKPSVECCGTRAIVAPGDPRHSYLVDKVEGVRLCSGQPMPLGGPPLTAAQEATLVGWICAGAPNN